MWNDIFHPVRLCRKVKWFFQRGSRGWADCDTWGLDDYLNSWMPKALVYLKAHKHGIPTSIFEEADGTDEFGNPTPTARERASPRWDATLDKMIEAFEANKRMRDVLYEEELGEYPTRRPKGFVRKAWREHMHQHYLMTQELANRDQEIFEEGMALFIKHYNSLWD
jgi:hypothetical protein